MGSTIKRTKSHGSALDQAAAFKTRTLSCGCTTEKPPLLSKPDKWFCCGSLRRAKATR